MVDVINPIDLKIALNRLGEVGKGVAVTYIQAVATPEGPGYLSETGRWAIGKAYTMLDPEERIKAIRNYFDKHPEEIEYMIKEMNNAGIVDQDDPKAVLTRR